MLKCGAIGPYAQNQALRFAAVGCVGFLAWFRARARGIFLRESLSKVAAGLDPNLLLL